MVARPFNTTWTTNTTLIHEKFVVITCRKMGIGEGLAAIEIFSDASGKFAVFFVGGIRREIHVLRDVSTQVDDGTPG